MHRSAEEQKKNEKAVVKREDAESAAGVEGLEEMGDVQGVEQDTGDQKAGEHKEEIDADIRGSADLVQEIEEARVGVGVRPEEVVEEHEEYGEAANSIERRDVGEAARVLGIAGSKGHKGASAIHVWIIHDPGGLGAQPRGFGSFSLQSKDMSEIVKNESQPPPEGYSAEEIEPKWQAVWDADAKLYAAEDHDSGKPKFYCLEMLPYPSGALHIGHVRNYAIGDALARHMWMRGYNVLHPMGWDAFGLPAENAALKNGVPPREWTLGNIAAMRKQMQRMGFSYDWATEVTTCLPEYYRWNQWFFLKMFERGLAYRKKSKVNWCPECATVLANEQVVGGMCWRHEDTVVELRDLTQWFLRITKYADELLDGLDKLDGWPEKVRTMQRNWIGRSEGALVDFAVEGEVKAPGCAKITVFTTLIDTIFGATSVQLAPEHAVAKAFAAEDAALAAKIEGLLAEQQRAREAGDVGAIEKHGVDTGRFAVNPFNGELVPIWVGNYILADYGTAATLGRPG